MGVGLGSLRLAQMRSELGESPGTTLAIPPYLWAIAVLSSLVVRQPEYISSYGSLKRMLRGCNVLRQIKVCTDRAITPPPLSRLRTTEHSLLTK